MSKQICCLHQTSPVCVKFFFIHLFYKNYFVLTITNYCHKRFWKSKVKVVAIIIVHVCIQNCKAQYLLVCCDSIIIIIRSTINPFLILNEFVILFDLHQSLTVYETLSLNWAGSPLRKEPFAFTHEGLLRPCRGLILALLWLCCTIVSARLSLVRLLLHGNQRSHWWSRQLRWPHRKLVKSESR